MAFPEPRAEVGQRSVLRAAFVLSGGKTEIRDKYHTAPVKIAKAFQIRRQLAAIVMDVSPGMLEGDRYEMEWTAGEGTHVMITNQSFMKVHPCGDGGSASLSQTFRLGAGAIVEHMPEPVMLYKDAAFRSETTVRLRPGSVWMQADVLCPGRGLRGERFRYREYDNRLSVYAEDELIFAQRQRISPEYHRLHAVGSWEGMTHWAYFFVFSDRVDPALIERLQEVIEAHAAPEGHPVAAAASTTYKHGAAVSACSTAAWPLQALMRELWDAARDQLLGLPPLRLLQG
ncbi:urease accessory protein UreD [Paenibacillus sp. LHD-117]|uniref:urease accessory protein UreD n=1 Tax=Paenibacillus sp. LHD-117 TaxID=3071412 RepID=UPI0027E0408A|nr:urease accessory protein UreD [Paenibacillus sp. LHD-117]MDQ6418550.1 urease accessory protein UreD [Paenibacillus sp. LHD-117]